MARTYPAPPGKDTQVRTRLATLTLATLLSVPAWAAPALADQGPATGSAPGSGSAHSLLPAASGPGSEGSGSESGSAGSGPGSAGPGSGSGESGSGPAGSGSGSGESGSGSGSGNPGSGSGGPGSDHSRSATGTSPRHPRSSQHWDSRPGLRAGPRPASKAGASAAEPAPSAATPAAEPTTGAPASAAGSAPPVGSVADRREGFPRLSTPPGLAVVAGVAGGALLFVAMVAAGFRARARLGRLG
jgi:hypothetical protein